MGNRGLSRSLGLGNKTKEFQSIAPFPANEVSQEEKIENVKNSRAAIQEVGRIDDHQVKDGMVLFSNHLTLCFTISLL